MRAQKSPLPLAPVKLPPPSGLRPVTTQGPVSDRCEWPYSFLGGHKFLPGEDFCKRCGIPRGGWRDA